MAKTLIIFFGCQTKVDELAASHVIKTENCIQTQYNFLEATML